MTRPAMLTAWATITGRPQQRTQAARVVLDDGWQPYGVANLTLPLSDALAAALAPAAIRAGTVRVQVLVRRQWYAAPTLAELGEAWAGMTLAQVGAELAGMTLAQVSTGLVGAWAEADPWRAPDELTGDLVVTGRTIEQDTASIVVRAATDEATQQRARSGPTGWVSDGIALPEQTATTRIAALAGIAGISVSTAGLPAITVPAETVSQAWAASLFERMMTAAAVLSRRLWCGLDRVWRLSDPASAPPTTVHVDRAEIVTDDLDVASGSDGASAVVWVSAYTWSTWNLDQMIATGSAAEVFTYPTPLPASVRPVLIVEEQLGDLREHTPSSLGMEPTPSQLAARLARAQAEDRRLTITAPADPSLRPGVAITTGPPSLPTLAGTLRAVEFRLPEDTMTLTITAVEEA